MRNRGRSTIRRRFVPALARILIVSLLRHGYVKFMDIYKWLTILANARAIPLDSTLDPSSGDEGSQNAIHDLVGFRKAKSIYSSEQTENRMESAIRRRFVLKLFPTRRDSCGM